MAAERALKPGVKIAVVTFHSLEDRIVKRFFTARSVREANANRYAPATETLSPRFDMLTRRAVAPDEAEVDANPRARSAKLRVAMRTTAPSGPVDPSTLGVPLLQRKGRR